jgi:Protein of unknown function (DUF3175)
MPTSKTKSRRPATRRWSAEVMRTSHALELEPDVFKKRTAAGIARSLKRSAEKSRQRKAEPFRSAMSMLNFYINRGGRTIAPDRRRVLEQAKDELRKLYGRPAGGSKRSRRPAGP